MKEFHDAMAKSNINAINQQADEGLSYGHSNGMVETKADMIKNIETGFIKYSSIKEDSIQVTINENLASVRFIADIAVSLNGKFGEYHLKVLEVWVKKGEGWLLFARQAVK